MPFMKIIIVESIVGIVSLILLTVHTIEQDKYHQGMELGHTLEVVSISTLENS